MIGFKELNFNDTYLKSLPMISKLPVKLAAIVVFFAGFAIISIPSALLLYLIAWLASLLWTIDFGAWQTHAIIALLAVVWTIYAINTKEGDEIISKVVTGKR